MILCVLGAMSKKIMIIAGFELAGCDMVHAMRYQPLTSELWVRVRANGTGAVPVLQFSPVIIV
jgi:hypothetical protein